MSIEKNLQLFAEAQARTADALEAIVQLLTKSGPMVDETPVKEENEPTKPVQKKAEKAPPAPPVTEVPEKAPPAPPVTEAPVAVQDAQHCDQLLIAEYQRLGANDDARTKIQSVISGFGVRTVSEMSLDDMGKLVAQVRKL